MKKICHLSSVHKPNDTRIFLKECKSLANAGYDVHLVVQHDKDEVIDGVNIWGIDKPKNRIERMTKTVNEVYKRALEVDAKIYHFHDPELIPIGLRLKRKGKKVIYDVHEDVPEDIYSKEWIPAIFHKPISWLIEQIEKHAAKRYDYIVTATPLIRDRFSTINNKAIDVNNYPILSELYIPKGKWSVKEKLVCYIGGVTKVRGINEMVDAIGMTDYSLLLAGSFVSSDERNVVVEKEGWSKIIELGYVNRTEVKEILARSMAGLVASHPITNYIDALPTKMFEYMSAGIPVIVSNFPLLISIIENSRCGICVDPLNPVEIANAIKKIIEDPNEAKQMGENGRRAIEEKYNWEMEEGKILKLYEELSES